MKPHLAPTTSKRIGRCSKTAKDVAGQIAKEWELKAQKDKTGRLLSLEVQDHCSKGL